ncbi:hypothetical protein MBLNU459_g5032t1 [Dothideomycetes sp. NU459]
MVGAVELPTEIWLEILSYLDYFSLRRCSRINKSFQSLIEFPAFDNTLFRSAPVVLADGYITMDNMRIHPAFRLLDWDCEADINEVIFGMMRNPETQESYYKESWDHEFTGSSAANEHATDPAVSRIRVALWKWSGVEARNVHGVTVFDVMKAACRYFAEDDSDGWPREGSVGEYNHIGWDGWDQPGYRVQDGCLMFEPDLFEALELDGGGSVSSAPEEDGGEHSRIESDLDQGMVLTTS